MSNHTNEARKKNTCLSNGDKILNGDSPSDIQIDNKNSSDNSHLKVDFEAVEWQKITEIDSRVCFKVGKSSSSSSPDTPDPSENRKLADKAGDCALKAASVCRLVARITFDAVDVGKKLQENSCRKAAEVDSQFSLYYISVAEKYKIAVNNASEKACDAEGAARLAHIAGGNALKASKRLSELKDTKLKDVEDANFQVAWATAIAKRTKSQSYKIACTTLEALKTFWKDLCNVRSEEMHFNGNVNEQSRRKMKFVNIVLLCVFLLGCLIMVYKNYFNFVKTSDTLISAGVTLIVGSIMGFVINAQYSNIEGVAQTEKIRKAMLNIDECLYSLENYFKKNKFSLEISSIEEELSSGIISFPDSLNEEERKKDLHVENKRSEMYFKV